MGWADCGVDSRGRRIGYAVRARCDEPGCYSRIDRGLSYACGGMHGEDEVSCGGYFCQKHLYVRIEVLPLGRKPSGPHQLCKRCSRVWTRGGRNR